MHELSIADAVVQIVVRHAAGRRVTRVDVRVGALRQLVPPALEFAFGLVARGTVAEEAELVLEHVPATGRCRACGAESLLEAFPFVCGTCGGCDLELVAGEELVVDALECEDDMLTATGGLGRGE